MVDAGNLCILGRFALLILDKIEATGLFHGETEREGGIVAVLTLLLTPVCRHPFWRAETSTGAFIL